MRMEITISSLRYIGDLELYNIKSEDYNIYVFPPHAKNPILISAIKWYEI